MTLEENKSIIRRYAEQVWNSGNAEAIDTFIADNYVRHDAGIPMQIRGPEGIRQLFTVFRTGFPDINFSADLMMADGDMVAVVWQMTGTHKGELMGIPATGKPVAIKATEIYRIADGKIAEQWVAVDNLGMMQQIGAVPVAG